MNWNPVQAPGRGILALAMLVLPAHAQAPATPSERTVMPIAFDLQRNPQLRFRIDSYVVPETSRGEFLAAVQRNLAFLRTLKGFHGHVVFEKTEGPSAFNLVTLAVWENQEAVDKAVGEVRAYYRRIGFDPPAMLARWGVTPAQGSYHAPAALQ